MAKESDTERIQNQGAMIKFFLFKNHPGGAQSAQRRKIKTVSTGNGGCVLMSALLVSLSFVVCAEIRTH